MQTQDLSYKLNNHHFEVKLSESKVDVSVEVFSLENVYTLPKPSLVNGSEYRFNNLIWGNDVFEPADVIVDVLPNTISAKINFNRDIRSVKYRFDNLPLGKLISMTDGEHEVTEYGRNYHYPEGWRSMSHPLLVFKLENGKYLFVRSLENTVERKYFFVKKIGEHSMRVDVVQEQHGTSLSHSFNAPMVEFGVCNTKEEIYESQSKLMEKNYNLQPFENSKIVPPWLKDISLVVTMHMETFTGYVFHTYEKAYEDILKLSKYVDPRRILVYMAGWEGRYYYKYGNYCPDERMGGEEKLKFAVKKMKELGCKVIAMYGINIVNKNLPMIKNIYEESEFQSISGAKYHNGSVDWEGAHHYDFNELVNLNIASPLWGNELYKQIKENTLKYDFDGAFLDIAACYVNDRNHSLFKGVCDFCDRLRTIKKDFLVSGEGFYDGLAKAIPLFQSGHTDGEMHYHDYPSEELFTKYVREFAHLCLGDPSRGSSGVHELGTNTLYKTPLRKGIIPTISLVEDSIDENNQRFMEIIDLVHAYEKEFLHVA